jgi:hypothetical protein
MRKIIICYFILIPIFIQLGCNQGITPVTIEEEQQKTGFSGKINFTGTWPDSVKWTLLVVFKDPLISAASFNFFNVGYISHPIPSGTKLFTYSTEQDTGYVPIAAGAYSYVAVAQSRNPVLSINRADWKVVGVYYSAADSSQPGKLQIPPNKVVGSINISCDFNNPPSQPPGGN